MFGRKKNKKMVTTQKPQEIRTLIGEGCVFEGNITTNTSTRIDGHIKGSVNGQGTMIIGEKGIVSGEVKANEIIVYGTLEGTIETQRLEIRVGGQIEGDIFTKSLIIEDGGIYNGKCFMDSKSVGTIGSAVEIAPPEKQKIAK